jgi:hypothetical protein
MTATAATNDKQQRPTAAHNARTIPLTRSTKAQVRTAVREPGRRRQLMSNSLPSGSFIPIA